MPIVVGTFGTVPKSLETSLEELEIREIFKTTQNLYLTFINSPSSKL